MTSHTVRSLHDRIDARHMLPAAVVAMVVVVSILEPAFLSADNLIGILRQMALVGIMATCTTFVIMTGGVDLSVGPVLALAGLVAFFALEAGLPLPVVLAAGLLVGLLVGAANGLVVALFGLPPIIVTLAALSIVRGSALILGGPGQHLLVGHDGYAVLGTGLVAGIPVSILIFAAVAAAMIGLQRNTALGIAVAAIGESERAARLSGHRVTATKTLVYALSGFGAALAGMIQSSQVHTALATYGPFGTELDVIAAVVLGGTSINGGTGSVARTVLGVLFLSVMNTAMAILDMPIDVQLIVKGAIIVAALALAEWRIARQG